MDSKDSPAGLAPSSDTPRAKQRRVTAGRGLVLFVCAVAVAAFALYAFIVLYGTWASQ